MASLGNMNVGDIVKIKENGVPIDFYVAKHDYESGLNGTGRTLVVRKDCYDVRVWDGDNVNTYLYSDIDEWLNGTYKNLLDADIRGAIGTTKFYYTRGNTTNTVTAVPRSIFLLSVTELGKSPSYANTEGSALPIASSLQIAYRNNSAVEQWTRSAVRSDSSNSYYLTKSGRDYYDDVTSAHGSRPAFTLPSNLSVSGDGTVSLNAIPTITSDTPSGTDLGEISESIELNYTVSDEDGDAMTVSEYVDDLLTRSIDSPEGGTYTFGAVSGENWKTILNGSHTLKVIANDGKGDSSPYTVTFNKQKKTATISLAEPLPADDVIKAAAIAVTGHFPEDSTLTVLVTNNALDDSPVWEDMTASVANSSNHVFTNQTAANGFAFNFRITATRGASDEQGYISSIGGAFE